MAMSQMGMDITCAWELVQPSCARMVGAKDAIEEAPMSQQKKRIVLWVVRDQPTFFFATSREGAREGGRIGWEDLQNPDFPVYEDPEIVHFDFILLFRAAIGLQLRQQDTTFLITQKASTFRKLGNSKESDGSETKRQDAL